MSSRRRLHLGAFMSWAPADRDRMFAVNVEGTRRLLDAASAAGVRRFVFASSGEVYPENRPEFLPVTEDLSIRAELLEDGGPAMWEAFMEELRAIHRGAPYPARSVFGELQAAYEATVARRAQEAC